MNKLDRLFQKDNDAVDRLPLAILPIKTKALGEACLVKNSQLEGAVELFSDSETGSGQINTSKLPEIFDFTKENERDLDIVSELSYLPSYDVYSLRMELRDLGLDVDQERHLRLSEEKADELASYMQGFTRPLVRAVYGKNGGQAESFDDILGMLSDPDVEVARRNLMTLAESFGVELADIPLFLEQYGDTYLSLAYYSYLLDQISSPLTEFADTLKRVRGDRQYQSAPTVMNACDVIEDRLIRASMEISNILESFQAKTQDMWEDISAAQFRHMRQLIISYQRGIGGSLCALTVKMHAWSNLSGKASLSNCVQFTMSEMLGGIEKITSLEEGPACPGAAELGAAGPLGRGEHLCSRG